MCASRAEKATPSLLEPTTLRHARVAEVALLRNVDRVYSYMIPDELAERVQPGMRLTVPYGRGDKPLPAYCLAITEKPWDSTLKPIIDIVDDVSFLSPQLIELGRWMAEYYAAPLGRTLDWMVPAAVKKGAGLRNVRYARLTTSDESPTTLPAKQAKVVAAMRSAADNAVAIDRLLNKADCTNAVIKSLEKKGVLSIEIRREPTDGDANTREVDDPAFHLTDHQTAAIDQIASAIAKPEFLVHLLFGVTGSGKTEVYIQAIRRALAAGKQGILLVPEIALTTQTVDRLALRFANVATIHSGMTESQRAQHWRRIRNGTANVVIGTRSAIFAPCPNLGVIIVDEEQEPSYKSQSAPRYHTRDVAVMRGHTEGIPVVLGSATPSLESWLNVKRRKHYRLIRLPQRVRGQAAPNLTIVDMNDEHRERRGVHMLSRPMEAGLVQTLERGEQAVLLLNRRGYASYVHCPVCRTPMSCPKCDVRLVYHESTRQAQCHYCRTSKPVPERCPMLDCDGHMVKFGLGTERVEEELGRKFPRARVRRIDSDAMTKASDYADILGAFERREFDLLVGTQMVAKGLDFPFVSFVGIVSADTALAFDDFRAEERTFQLVLQVAGRSGRGETAGNVIVQTFAADAAPIRHAVQGDYEAFANEELERRRLTGLPPFTRMVRIVFLDGNQAVARKAAEQAVTDMRGLFERYKIAATVYAAQPANIQRLREMYRFDTTIIFATANGLVTGMKILRDENVLRSKAKRVTVDVDPISLQ